MRWFITGASKGFGRAIAQAALERGDTVFGTVRGEADAAAFAALAPGLATGLVADVIDRAAINRAVAAAGEIDVLVNNAGVGITGAIEEYSGEDVRALFDVNVFGAIAVLQAVLPGMRARRAGRILNITSVSGWAPWAGTALYGATKFALECVGRTLAQEVADYGIRVTNVAPGGLRTDFSAGSLRSASNPIEGYEGPAHEAERTLRGHAGEEPGDPVLAAAAVLRVADSFEPPLRLLLGTDALGYAEGEMAAMKADIDAWRETTLSIAYR
ncbi:oxidoreductase [Sphingomonas sp. BK235]|uniref:oxidoreductase n=1 Tax=Sphingomonas sp. BK235 TaxID=2512131 RepID=UPI00104A2ABC|nr:oxidoreductase [Sphingomonas sp. BK235]TCP29879.1 NADP-dependent 3-hydroxy acid dehydrogenase YdfG [Sphingomonas sp. BK235]